MTKTSKVSEAGKHPPSNFPTVLNARYIKVPYRASLKLGEIQADCEMTTVEVIHKAKYWVKTNNCRPVSLKPSLCECLKRKINLALLNNRLLTWLQQGFVKSRSFSAVPSMFLNEMIRPLDEDKLAEVCCSNVSKKLNFVNSFPVD